MQLRSAHVCAGGGALSPARPTRPHCTQDDSIDEMDAAAAERREAADAMGIALAEAQLAVAAAEEDPIAAMNAEVAKIVRTVQRKPRHHQQAFLLEEFVRTSCPLVVLAKHELLKQQQAAAAKVRSKLF